VDDHDRMVTPAFDALRDVVLSDPDAQARLRATDDWEGLVTAARQLAVEHGIELEPEDLEIARADARRSRIGHLI